MVRFAGDSSTESGGQNESPGTIIVRGTFERYIVPRAEALRFGTFRLDDKDKIGVRPEPGGPD